MARFPASRIFFGVGKSGSPTLRLITSIPADLSSAALDVMANVADDAIRPILFENIIISEKSAVEDREDIRYSWNLKILGYFSYV